MAVSKMVNGFIIELTNPWELIVITINSNSSKLTNGTPTQNFVKFDGKLMEVTVRNTVT